MSTQIRLRLPDDMATRLERLASEMGGVDLGEVIRHLIGQHLAALPSRPSDGPTLIRAKQHRFQQPGFVYLARLDGLFKIGLTADIDRRMRQLGADLVHSIAVPNRSFRLERPQG